MVSLLQVCAQSYDYDTSESEKISPGRKQRTTLSTGRNLHTDYANERRRQRQIQRPPAAAASLVIERLHPT